MSWTVELAEEFVDEFNALRETVQGELLAHAKLLEQFGPTLGRPTVDTLKRSKHSNLKELRFDADNGVWRTAFAFDPRRHGVLLAAGDKSARARSGFIAGSSPPPTHDSMLTSSA